MESIRLVHMGKWKPPAGLAFWSRACRGAVRQEPHDPPRAQKIMVEFKFPCVSVFSVNSMVIEDL